MNRVTIVNDLERVNESLDLQIAEVHKMSDAMGVEAHQVQDMHGRHLLNELLVAKAQVLMTLANFVED